MKTNIFPINPTFITRLKEYRDLIDPDGLNDYALNDHGVLEQDLIHGFLTVVSHEKLVKSPITLYEFIPKRLESEEDLKEKIRNKNIRFFKVDDSLIATILNERIIIQTNNVEFFNIKKCCLCYRNHVRGDADNAGIRRCDELNSRVGFLALETLTEDNFKIELDPYINRFNIDKNDDKIIIIPKNNKNNLRPYLYYRCPISGFYEIIFPIFHENRIVGCIMVGEVLEEELNENDIFEKFTSEFERIKRPLSEVKEQELRNAIKFDIKNEYKKITNYRGILNPVENNIEFISSINEKIINIERHLRKIINLYRQRYVSAKFLEIKMKFQKDALSENSLKGKLEVTELSKIIENSLIKIIEYFPNDYGFIRIFMADISGEEKKLKIMAASDRNSKNYSDDFTYDLSVIPNDIEKKGKDVSKHDKDTGINIELLKCIERGILYRNKEASNFVKDTDIVRYYPTLASKVCFVIWTRYTPEFQNNLNQFELFKNAMFDFYTFIAANYSALWGSQMDKNLENTIRIASHESNQMVPVIIDSLNCNFRNEFGAVPFSIADILDQLELLKLGQTIHSFAFKEIDFTKYPKTDIDLRDLINRFKSNFYKKQIQRKKLYFRFDSERNERIFINGNYVLIEHAINNLIDNAVKYSYRGTTITVLFETTNDNLIFHVQNCGSQIPNNSIIFNLYTRGMDTEHIEGNGIGLFLCRKLIEAHGWKIDFNSKEIYPYDIACMASYIKNRDIYNIVDQKYEIMSQQFKTHSAEKYVSKKFDNPIYLPGSSTFKEEYLRKTFLNDFYITINRESIKKDYSYRNKNN